MVVKVVNSLGTSQNISGYYYGATMGRWGIIVKKCVEIRPVIVLTLSLFQKPIFPAIVHPGI